MEIIISTDLPAALQAADSIDLMIDGANAIAARVAPCLDSNEPAPTTEQVSEARLILLGMIKRWVEAGSGAFSQQTAGPFGMVVDTRQKSSGYRAWPSEIADLQVICAEGSRAGKAGHVDMWDTGS